MIIKLIYNSVYMQGYITLQWSY